MNAKEFRAFVAGERWTFAKSYVMFAPHEYVVRGRTKCSNEEFDRAGECIIEHGMRMFYYKAERKYLFLDGWFYWILRDEENPSNAVINRCRPEDYDIVFMRRGTQARALQKEQEQEREKREKREKKNTKAVKFEQYELSF